MPSIKRIVFYGFLLMSALAGIVKVIQMPQEVAFFAAAGIGIAPLIALGIVQLSGGLIALSNRYRQLGLGLAIAGFFTSVVVIAMTGDMSFAGVSMVPVLIGGLLLRWDLGAGNAT